MDSGALAVDMETREWIVRGKNMQKAFDDYANCTAIGMGPQRGIIVEAEFIDDGEMGLRISVAALKPCQ